jgi:hypothetical protein
MAPADEIARFWSRLSDSDGLNGPPWQDSRLDHGEFVNLVSQSLDEAGVWQCVGEFAMGGDVRVTVRRFALPSSWVANGEQGENTRRGTKISAECGSRISATFTKLEEALAAGSAFAMVVWDLIAKTEAWRYMAFHLEDSGLV